MIIIGIVGSPAGGKSSVAARLQERGATWINADRIARQVLEQEPISQQLIEHFGSDIAGNSGRIDRRRLAALVFGDDADHRAALNYLESVVHPPTRRLIMSRLKETAAAGVPAAVLEVPLLFESGWDRCCDEVWCVDAPLSRRRTWAAGRGWTAVELQRREKNQLPLSEKKRLSTLLVANEAELADLNETIDSHWGLLISKQNQRRGNPHCPTIDFTN